MSALSWADLTYVLPATSLSYVVVALIALIGFHEEMSPTRWLGIALIAAGVGFVADGPLHDGRSTRGSARVQVRSLMIFVCPVKV